MAPLRYDPNGMHIVELFAEPSLFDLLPGIIPTDDSEGDEWNDELMDGGN